MEHAAPEAVVTQRRVQRTGDRGQVHRLWARFQKHVARVARSRKYHPGKEAAPWRSSRLDDVREQRRHRPRPRWQPQAFKETVDGEDRRYDRARDGVRRYAAESASVRRRGVDRLSTAGGEQQIATQSLTKLPPK